MRYITAGRQPLPQTKHCLFMQKRTEGHRERLRDRLRADGATLPECEVLELLLGHVLTRKDTKPLAKELLVRFQSMRGVLDARETELAAVPGFGPGLATFWVLLREVLARYAAGPALRREVMASPKVVAAIAQKRLSGCPHEEMWAAYVDTQNRLLAWERASRGSLETVPLQPRDVVERALTLKATGIILVHNHPGGSSRPSGQDLELTHKVAAAAKTLGIRLLDHVIVTDTACHSITQEGLLNLNIL